MTSPVFPSVLFLVLATTPFVHAQTTTSPTVEAAQTAVATTPTTTPAKELTLNGQRFTLANNSSSGLVTTFEYVLAGEPYETWTQLLTHQIIGLANPVTAEEFVSYFQRKIRESDPGSSITIARLSPKAAVFQVHFPRTEVQDEQIMICLAFPDPQRAEMNVVQYALKPNRLSTSLVELQVKSWLNLLSVRAAAVAEQKPPQGMAR